MVHSKNHAPAVQSRHLSFYKNLYFCLFSCDTGVLETDKERPGVRFLQGLQALVLEHHKFSGEWQNWIKY